MPWQGRQIEVSLDNVDEVGTFVELELVTEPADVDAAKRCTALLAKPSISSTASGGATWSCCLNVAAPEYPADPARSGGRVRQARPRRATAHRGREVRRQESEKDAWSRLLTPNF